MPDGITLDIMEFAEFLAQIVDLEATLRAAVLDDLIGNVFLRHNFLVMQHIAWDYNGYIIHLGRERRVSVSWRNPVTLVTVENDL